MVFQDGIKRHNKVFKSEHISQCNNTSVTREGLRGYDYFSVPLIGSTFTRNLTFRVYCPFPSISKPRCHNSWILCSP